MTRRQFRKELINHLYQYDLLGQKQQNINNEVNEVFAQIIINLNSIDDVIETNLTNYTIDRLSFVDRAIIRLAVYEMLYTDTPKQIIINEAIELTKTLADIDDKQKSFTNRVLDKIKKEIGD